MKFAKPFILVIISLLVLTCSHDEQVENVATVGKINITKTDFSKRYAEFLEVSGMKDNLKVRYDYLRMLVDEIVLLSYAENSGFANRPETKSAVERKRDQIYINYYFESYIHPKLTIDESELREAFRRSKIKVHARHLYAPTLEKAWDIKQELSSGSSFEELAKKYFSDPELANNSGDLGWFSFDEMEPAFENASYLLEIGEISYPVKTSDGYSIVQVLNKEVNPFILEHEYKENESWLQLEVKRRKSAEFLKKETDRIITDLDLVLNETIVEEIYNKMPQLREELLSGHLPELRIQNVSDNVLKSKNGGWDIHKTVVKLSEVQQKQWKRVKNLGDFRDVLKGLAVREEIENRIQREGIPEKAEVIRTVNKYRKSQILKILFESITDIVKISEDEFTKYYTDNKNEFLSSEFYEVAEIVVKDSTLAWDIFAQIDAGADFSELAREYSNQERSVKNGGYLGWGELPQFGKLAKPISKANIGNVINPFNLYDSYIILKVLNKRPPRQLTFDEVKNKIEYTLLPEKRKKSCFKFVKNLRADTDIWINEELVNNLVLDTQRGVS